MHISIYLFSPRDEQTKYLGGDERTTHLVKGLDYQLLQKTRQKLEHEQEAQLDKALENQFDEDDVKSPSTPNVVGTPAPKTATLHQSSAPAEEPVTAKSHFARSLQAAVQRHNAAVTQSSFLIMSRPDHAYILITIYDATDNLPKSTERFLPRRTAFVYDLDEDNRKDVPITLVRSKSDCPQDV